MNTTLDTRQVSAALCRRFQELFRNPRRDKFLEDMTRTVTRYLPLPQEDTVIQQVLTHFLTIYDNVRSGQPTLTRGQMAIALQALLDNLVAQAPPAPLITTQQARKTYLDAAYDATSNKLQQMMINTYLPTTPALGTNEQQLSNVLDLMKQGSMTAAVSQIIRRWQPSAIDHILTAGLQLYQLALRNDPNVQTTQTGLLHILISNNIHNHIINLDTSTVQELVGELCRHLPKVLATLREFGKKHSIVQEPFAITEKLSVTADRDPQTNIHHVGFLICYWNSLSTRYLMNKLDSDDKKDFRPDILHLQSTSKSVGSISTRLSASVRRPLTFQQLSNGSCCTMALMNFLINQSPATQGPITKTLVESIRTKQAQGEGYAHDAEHDEYLCSLHHHILAIKTLQELDPSDVEQPEPTSDDLSEGNHVVIVLPYNGFVWELDSLNDQRQTCLGAVGGDWKAVAQKRLGEWTKTASITGVAVDVQAFVQALS
ncbi:hypothetical protein BGX34_005638 [Mortierella sp. NVP85]|nr:hypothetical protein BGX34_005638 [Mortierella sp. NVP85]